MIKIKLYDLKEFCKKSRHIKHNTLNSMLGYIKIEAVGDTATLIKHSLDSFCVYEITASTDKKLNSFIDEKLLNKICELSNAQEITFDFSKKGCKISDGYYNFSFDMPEDVNTFPKLPNLINTGNPYILTTEMLQTIKIAKSHLGKPVMGVINNFNYLHILPVGQQTEIFCTNGHLFYLKKFEGASPKIFLSKETCNVLSEFDTLTYFSVDNYDLFKAEHTTYGFIKSDINAIQYTSLIDNIKTDQPFKVSKWDLINFCKSTIGIATTALPISKFYQTDRSKLSLSFQDTGFGVTNNVVAEIESNNISFTEEMPFVFNPVNFKDAIEALPYDTLNLAYSPTGGGYGCSVTSEEDKDYIGLWASKTIN